MMITLITPIIVLFALILLTIKYLVEDNQKKGFIPVRTKDESIGRRFK